MLRPGPSNGGPRLGAELASFHEPCSGIRERGELSASIEYHPQTTIVERGLTC